MTVIKQKKTQCSLPIVLREVLSPWLYEALCRAIYEYGAADEIRLRADRRASLSFGHENAVLDFCVSKAELENTVNAICGGSLYAHADTIRQGYVTLAGGVRVGLVGRASVSGGEILGVYDISGLCIRLPHKALNVGQRVCELLRSGCRGVLVYAPPAQGKTTLLRSVSAKMSMGEDAWRVSVIDSRGELAPALFGEGLCVDILEGYPRDMGIEIAARCMNAQLIVCDEISSLSEAEAIISACGCGVPMLATAHADNVRSLLSRPAMRCLYDACAFGAYVGIRRCERGGEFEYTVDMREELEV